MLEEMEANLSSKKGLTKLKIDFGITSETDNNDCSHDEAILESLKPHFNLRKLKIEGYKGENLPSWAKLDTLCINLPNLVVIELYHCTYVEKVPAFSQLPLLKCLKISSMVNLEYMENDVYDMSSSSSLQLFFPSLEELDLSKLEKLKGWWKGVEEIISENDSEVGISSELAGIEQQYHHHLLSMQFRNLSILSISKCPQLKFLPLCPKVENLCLFFNNECLSVTKMITTLSTTTTACSSSSGESGLKLKVLQMDNVEDQLTNMPKQCLHQLSSLSLYGDNRLESTESLTEVFTTLSSSLRYLDINGCRNLRSISRGLDNLTTLVSLRLCYCQKLDLSSPQEELTTTRDRHEGTTDMMMPWKALKTNLRWLELNGLSKLVVLPNGLQHLKNLYSLELVSNQEMRELPEWISCLCSLHYLLLLFCPKLTSLPEDLRNLKSLTQLSIQHCSGLTERCRRPNGSDCLKFQHVPIVIVLD